MKLSILLAVGLLGVAMAARADNSKANWLKQCAMCHGKDGQANTPAGKALGASNFTDPKVQASFTDEAAFKAVKEGITKDGREKMKSYADKLGDQDIKDLVAYLRTFKNSK